MLEAVRPSNVRMIMSGPILEGLELRKKFGTMYAVDCVSLAIGAWETVGLVGESGSGKTTLAKILCGLLEPSSGHVLYKGVDLRKLTRESWKQFRRGVQIVFQNPLLAFNPKFTIKRALLDAMRLITADKLQKEEKILDLLNEVNLDVSILNKRPSQLSGGQLQRVAFVRALLLDPQVICLDEPTSALDASIQGQILSLLVELQQHREISYLFITHDLKIAWAISQRIYVMYKGVIVEQGNADEMFNTPRHPYTALLFKAATGSIVGFARSTPLSDPTATLKKTGCRFVALCDRRKDRCFESEPPLFEIKGDYYVRCWEEKGKEGQ